jgi:hypothetical protein
VISRNRGKACCVAPAIIFHPVILDQGPIDNERKGSGREMKKSEKQGSGLEKGKMGEVERHKTLE